MAAQCKKSIPRLAHLAERTADIIVPDSQAETRNLGIGKRYVRVLDELYLPRAIWQDYWNWLPDPDSSH
jgi:hypothetical protein